MANTKMKNRSALQSTLNALSPSQLAREIGQKGINEIRNLHSWMESESFPPNFTLNAGPFTPDLRWRYRFAPSIITRSEAELFGISTPRFAIRVYLDNRSKDLNFVNARRSATFCDQARTWGRPSSAMRSNPDSAIKFRKITRRPCWLLRDNSCIGDCLLQIPKRFEKDNYFIKAELGNQYGEFSDQGKTCNGIPFVKHIPLAGGGLCAQAVCFMATTLMHRFARGVFGVAEVTTLAFPRSEQELNLSGLEVNQIVRYFSSDEVGLRTLPQRPLSKSTRQRELCTALRSYVMSGMPVILPMDGGRMAGLQPAKSSEEKVSNYRRSIFATNGLPQNFVENSPRGRRSHAVLVVGCCRDMREQTFVFNDPSQFPFMQASLSQIENAGIYEEERIESSLILEGLILPITPQAVLLPLLPYYEKPIGGVEQRQFGLFDIGDFLTRNALPLLETPTKCRPFIKSQYVAGECRLVTLQECELSGGAWKTLKALPDVSSGITEALADCLQRLDRAKWNNRHWTWLQEQGDSVWLWNAEKSTVDPAAIEPNTPLATLEKFVLAVIWRDANNILQQWVSPALPPGRDPRARPERSEKPAPSKTGDQGGFKTSKLRTSIISSFDILNAEISGSPYLATGAGMELYSFMQSQACKHFQLTPRLILEQSDSFLRYTAFQFLSNTKRRTTNLLWPILKNSGFLKHRLRRLSRGNFGWPLCTALDRIAEGRIRPCFFLFAKECLRFKIQIVALASFLPGIAADPEHSRNVAARKSKQAIINLLKIGSRLNQLGHSIEVLEIVAGSLIDGIWPAITHAKHGKGGGEFFIANKMTDQQGLERLASVLPGLAAEAQAQGIQLALEFEPGPNYVLGNRLQIQRICEILEANPVVKRWVGFNLDIAHWGFLEGITPDWILAQPAILNRIVHCHVSDHGRGHFGDVPIGRLHRRTEFASWIELIEEISRTNRPDGFPKFSRWISVEQESCKSLEMVHASVRNLRSITGGPNSWR